MVTITQIKQAFADHLTKKLDKPRQDVETYIEFLFQSGIIDKKTALRYVVRAEYLNRLINSTKKGLSIRLDLAVEFEVSENFINKAIYHYTKIRV